MLSRSGSMNGDALELYFIANCPRHIERPACLKILLSATLFVVGQVSCLPAWASGPCLARGQDTLQQQAVHPSHPPQFLCVWCISWFQLRTRNSLPPVPELGIVTKMSANDETPVVIAAPH